MILVGYGGATTCADGKDMPINCGGERKGPETMADQAKDAMLWEALDGQKVRCELCGHQCEIAAGKYGICRVRQNTAGALKALTHGVLVAMNADPA